MENFKLTTAERQKLYEYLARQPFIEVSVLIEMLGRLELIEEGKKK